MYRETEYKEIFKLKEMLDKANIPYNFLDRSETIKMFKEERHLRMYQIIVFYPHTQNRLISVVQSYASYGAEKDLLEIQGCLTDEELSWDTVLGYLSAEEVFKRIKKEYGDNNG